MWVQRGPTPYPSRSRYGNAELVSWVLAKLVKCVPSLDVGETSATEYSISPANEVFMGNRTVSEDCAPNAIHNGNRYPTPKDEYAAKLTTPSKAVEHIADGSTLCLALGVGMPGGLAKA